ncbi:MAG TPA: hypothetical protein VIG34_02870 [Xanthobacteraceae bacterium]
MSGTGGLRLARRYVDREVKQQERQRFAMTVETEAGVDATFQYVIKHEIERSEFRQIETHDPYRLARSESRGDTLGRYLRGHRRIMRWIAADQRYVEPVALIAGPRVGDLMETNRVFHPDAPNKVTRGSA